MVTNKEVIDIIRTAGDLSDYSLSKLRQIYADEYYAGI